MKACRCGNEFVKKVRNVAKIKLRLNMRKIDFTSCICVLILQQSSAIDTDFDFLPKCRGFLSTPGPASSLRQVFPIS